MSGTAIVRELLINHAPVTSIVPAGRIRAGILPQGTQLPAIAVTSVDENEFRTIARRGQSKQIRERVQVTVYTAYDGNGPGYAQLKTLVKACSLGPGVHKGIINGFQVNSVLPEGVGPEIPPGDEKIFEQSRDFMVTFVEAN